MRRENFAETTEQLIATGIIHRWEAWMKITLSKRKQNIGIESENSDTELQNQLQQIWNRNGEYVTHCMKQYSKVLGQIEQEDRHDNFQRREKYA
jgi:hypothetical protein